MTVSIARRHELPDLTSLEREKCCLALNVTKPCFYLPGDIDPTEGIIHADSIAESIANSLPETVPTRVYTSPFLRTTHTASILAKRLPKHGSTVNIEEGLYEYMIPSLLVDHEGIRTYPRSVHELKQICGNIDESYEQTVKITEEMYPEDENRLIERSRKALEGILKHASGENVAIVAHAPCVQALAFIMEGASSVEESNLDQWPLGGITMFSRSDIDSSYRMECYGQTDHMPGKYKNGEGLWSLPCFDKTRP